MNADVTFRSEQRLTQEEFFDWVQRLPGGDIHHYELIHGRIVMTPPAGFKHGGIGAELVLRLGSHVKSNGLGRVFDASTGYDLPSGDTLEPDVSYVSAEKLAAAGPMPERGFGKVVPDLVIEISSRSTARRDRTEKKAIYAANGVREYWLVDLRRRKVTVFHLRASRYDAGAVFTDTVTSDVLPGLAADLTDLFDL